MNVADAQSTNTHFDSNVSSEYVAVYILNGVAVGVGIQSSTAIKCTVVFYLLKPTVKVHPGNLRIKLSICRNKLHIQVNVLYTVYPNYI